jgi:AcrR family transcriptional regulator
MKYCQTMNEVVKPRRPYDATTRQTQSAATRQRIIDAARELILDRGYRATTIAAIASRADVNSDSVYALVGRKPVVLRELIERALSGTDHEVVGEERAHIKAMRAEKDPARKLAIYARGTCQIHQRLAPLFLALRDASSTEPEAQDVWQEISDRRAANMRKLVEDLRDSGGLRAGLSIDEGADIVWATNSPELYVLLVVERGWPVDRFEKWLAESWCRLLLR